MAFSRETKQRPGSLSLSSFSFSLTVHRPSKAAANSFSPSQLTPLQYAAAVSLPCTGFSFSCQATCACCLLFFLTVLRRVLRVHTSHLKPPHLKGIQTSIDSQASASRQGPKTLLAPSTQQSKLHDDELHLPILSGHHFAYPLLNSILLP